MLLRQYMSIGYVLYLSLIVSRPSCVSVSIAVSSTTLNNVAKVIVQTWEDLLVKYNGETVANKRQMINGQITTVWKTINNVETKIQGVEVVKTLGSSANGTFETNLENLLNSMSLISRNFDRLENHKHSAPPVLHDLLKSMLEKTHDLLSRMFNIMIGNEQSKGIFQEAIQNFESSSSSNICRNDTSLQVLFLKLYGSVALTGLRGYSVLQFSWLILTTYKKGDFRNASEHARIEFGNSIRTMHEILTRTIRNTNRLFFKCDPPKEHIEGETYEQLTRLLQGFIENEVNMNDAESCADSCENYRRLDQGCFRDCNSRYKCKGKIHNCWSIDTRTEICNSPANSTRRYEYIQYESGKVWGQKRNCPGGVGDVDSWSYWLFWRCSYCFCLCEEEGIKSDRYFSLRESVSNTAYNRIVTGVKFVKMNRIIHLQIQEGQLQPEGTVDRSTVQWVSIQEFNIIGKNVKIGRDIHILSMAKRSIDFDTLDANDTHIVTGVKLRLLDNHLSLQIRVTEFDFSTGRLLNPESSSYWMGNDNKEKKRTKLEIHQPDIPVRSVRLPSKIDSTDNMYMDFTHSSFDSDAAQSTIPFIDVQEVTSEPPVPFAGISLYHKGRSESGGFIAPMISTYNYINHLHYDIDI